VTERQLKTGDQPIHSHLTKATGLFYAAFKTPKYGDFTQVFFHVEFQLLDPLLSNKPFFIPCAMSLDCCITFPNIIA
jgi:hypothetical protein